MWTCDSNYSSILKEIATNKLKITEGMNVELNIELKRELRILRRVYNLSHTRDGDTWAHCLGCITQSVSVRLYVPVYTPDSNGIKSWVTKRSAKCQMHPISQRGSDILFERKRWRPTQVWPLTSTWTKKHIKHSNTKKTTNPPSFTCSPPLKPLHTLLPFEGKQAVGGYSKCLPWLTL